MKLRWLVLWAFAVGCSRPGARPAGSRPGSPTGAVSEAPKAEVELTSAASERAVRDAPDAGADEGAARAPRGSSPSPGTAQLRPDELQVGLSREALLRALGPCAHRVLLMTAAALPTEVYQPEEGQCVQRFGARQFYVVGERLERIQDGLSHYVPPQPVETDAPH